MSFIQLSRVHQAQLEQLTGCTYATLIGLRRDITPHLKLNGRGRPFKHSVLVMLCLALMKLRLNLTVRALEALTGIDAVTVSRCVARVTAALGELPLAKRALNNPMSMLLVDTTSSRVATTQLKAYSGYKHHRCAKVQVLSDEAGQVVDVSPAYEGSVHDKTIWNKQVARVRPLLDRLVLADKAYAGATGESQHLLRPVKRGENAWKANPDKAKQFNRELSKRRVRIEHVFARLKTWKVLGGLFPYRWEKLGPVVRALAVVHNRNRLLSRASC